MDINQEIYTAVEHWNDGRTAQADAMLREIEFSFYYGTGKDDLTRHAFCTLIGALKHFETFHFLRTSGEERKTNIVKIGERNGLQDSVQPVSCSISDLQNIQPDV
jgi:hypothetical protein